MAANADMISLSRAGTLHLSLAIKLIEAGAVTYGIAIEEPLLSADVRAYFQSLPAVDIEEQLFASVQHYLTSPEQEAAVKQYIEDVVGGFFSAFGRYLKELFYQRQGLLEMYQDVNNFTKNYVPRSGAK